MMAVQLKDKEKIKRDSPMTTNFLLTDHTYHIFKEILIQTLSILNNPDCLKFYFWINI